MMTENNHVYNCHRSRDGFVVCTLELSKYWPMLHIFANVNHRLSVSVNVWMDHLWVLIPVDYSVKNWIIVPKEPLLFHLFVIYIVFTCYDV